MSSNPQIDHPNEADRERLRNMSEEEIEAGAASDPDNPPWSKEVFKRARVIEAGWALKPVIRVHADEERRRRMRGHRGGLDRLTGDLLCARMEEERAGEPAEGAQAGGIQAR